MVHKLRWLGLILGAFLITGFAAVFFWWQYYKTTPAYSLAVLVDAAQRNDVAAFDRIIDMEKVIDNFVSQLTQSATGGLASDVANSLRIQLQSLAPGVMTSVKHIVGEEIRKRINELAASDGARPFFLTALAIPFKTNISEKNDTAKATINTGDRHLELLMERRDGGWKVVSMRDDALAARIVNGIVKDLPGSGLQFEREMRKQLRDLPETLRELPLHSDK
jgi:hypothetical protein